MGISLIFLVTSIGWLGLLFYKNYKTLLYTDRNTLVATMLSSAFVISNAIENNKTLPINGFLIAAAFTAVLGIIYIMTKGIYFGLGDVKLSFPIFLLLGYPATAICFFVLILSSTIFILGVKRGVFKVERISSSPLWLASISTTLVVAVILRII